MRLALSSAAAPQASLAELAEACARRGIDAVFLSAGTAATAELDASRSRSHAVLEGSGLALAGIEASGWDAADDDVLAVAAAELQAPVVVRAEPEGEALGAAAARYGRHGARLLISVPTDPAVAGEMVTRLGKVGSAALGLAWDVRPGKDDPAAIPDVLAAVGDRLRLVRLWGGGPETIAQGGARVGPLMARMTLARFAGMLVIGPSRPEHRTAWAAWLRRRAGTGCGSAPETTTLRMGASR